MSLPEFPNAMVIMLAEDEDDFLWRCAVCGASGHGSKSEKAHVKRTRHGLKQIAHYIPQDRYDHIVRRIENANETLAAVNEQVPGENARVFEDDDHLRTFIGRLVMTTFVDGFESSNNEHSDTLDHIVRLLWNDSFWRGWNLDFADEEQRHEQQTEDFKDKQARERVEYAERTLPRLRDQVESLEKVLDDA